MTEEAQTTDMGQDGPALRTGLADIDRKLRALQEELAAADSGDAATLPGPPAPTPPPPSPPAPSAPAPSPPAEASPPAEDLALAIIGRAEEQASRIVGEAHERVVALSRQAEQLMALRDGLRQSARELLERYASALAQIEQDTAGPAWPPVHARPEPPRGVTGPFTIVAEPFAQVAELAAFAQALERIRGAQGITIHSFDGRRAEIGVTFSVPVALVRELHRVIPFAIEVNEERADSLDLRLGAGPAG
ncbi:MAG: hypothetical protein ACR2K9_07410 [Solirubrobacteraceae bacterium]